MKNSCRSVTCLLKFDLTDFLQSLQDF